MALLASPSKRVIRPPERGYQSYRNYLWGEFRVAYIRQNYKRTMTDPAEVTTSG